MVLVRGKGPKNSIHRDLFKSKRKAPRPPAVDKRSD